MRIGQFEEIFLTPVSGLEYILSWSVFGISRVTIESVPILILALLSNLLTIKPLNLLLFICSFVISIIASFGFVFLFFGLTLLLKDADELVSLVGNAAPLIGGMFFPVTVLPKFLRYVSYVFPFTWGLDLSRHFLMGTKTIFDLKSEFMIFTVISFLYIIAGYLSYVILQHKARQKGVHGF
jgi:ABC-2 type transport system permease protein